jgi:hypothetical protein
MYDVNNDHGITRDDPPYFAASLNDYVVDPQASLYAYACEFDGDGHITFGDAALMATNLNDQRSDSDRLLYCPDFPENWPPQPQLLRLAAKPLVPDARAPLSDEQMQPVIKGLSENRVVAGLLTEPLARTEGLPPGSGIGSWRALSLMVWVLDGLA